METVRSLVPQTHLFPVFASMQHGVLRGAQFNRE